jgi:hypothetical protein
MLMFLAGYELKLDHHPRSPVDAGRDQLGMSVVLAAVVGVVFHLTGATETRSSSRSR